MDAGGLGVNSGTGTTSTASATAPATSVVPASSATSTSSATTVSLLLLLLLMLLGVPRASGLRLSGGGSSGRRGASWHEGYRAGGQVCRHLEWRLEFACGSGSHARRCRALPETGSGRIFVPRRFDYAVR